ncbi:hypothetical protein [Flavobacterium sp.]|uniref:hypothetical protein n=1 Tax=Flavobacterium sp. TaxID=239 RepID=UPI003D11F447
MSLYSQMFEGFKEKYLGFATLAILGQSCLGSVAAMYILKNGTSVGQMFQLAIVVMICMAVNGSILSQQKAKLVFNLIISSVVSSTFFIILNTAVI